MYRCLCNIFYMVEIFEVRPWFTGCKWSFNFFSDDLLPYMQKLKSFFWWYVQIISNVILPTINYSRLYYWKNYYAGFYSVARKKKELYKEAMKYLKEKKLPSDFVITDSTGMTSSVFSLNTNIFLLAVYFIAAKAFGRKLQIQ